MKTEITNAKSFAATGTQIVKSAISKCAQAREEFASFLIGTVVGLMCAHPAMAGFLSKALCKPYRQLVDSELFITIGVIMAAVLVIAWKLAPSGTYLAKGVGLLAGITIGLNIENIMQLSFGSGLAC